MIATALAAAALAVAAQSRRLQAGAEEAARAATRPSGRGRSGGGD